MGDAVLTAAHLINSMPSRVHLQAPLECLNEFYSSTQLIPDVPLRMYGCTSFVLSHVLNHTKFASRVQSCDFVGYSFH